MGLLAVAIVGRRRDNFREVVMIASLVQLCRRAFVFAGLSALSALACSAGATGAGGGEGASSATASSGTAASSSGSGGSTSTSSSGSGTITDAGAETGDGSTSSDSGVLTDGSTDAGAPTPGITRPFTPPLGSTLLVIGQDLETVAAYRSAVTGSTHETSYSDIQSGQTPIGLISTTNQGSGDLNVSMSAGRSAVVAVGVYLVNALPCVTSGACDSSIDAFATTMRSFPDVAFLMRLGYEFDGPWNGYNASEYQGAYQYIVNRWKNAGVQNFASVWQSCAYTSSTTNATILNQYYPGDTYVDWVGMSYFSQVAVPQAAVIDFARAHAKPLMICESAPQGYDLTQLTWAPTTQAPTALTTKTAAQIWSEWFVPYLQLIHANADVIRAVAYIDADWNAQPMWGPASNYTQGYWGDSRVQGNTTILANWLNEVGSSFWVK
jgi:hypothetical protein